MLKPADDEGHELRQQCVADFEGRFHQPEYEIDWRLLTGRPEWIDRRHSLGGEKLNRFVLFSRPQALSSSPSLSIGGVLSPAWLTAAWPAPPVSPRPPAPPAPVTVLSPTQGTKPSPAPTLPRRHPCLCGEASRWEGGRCCVTPISRGGTRTTSWSPTEGASGRLTTSTCCSDGSERGRADQTAPRPVPRRCVNRLADVSGGRTLAPPPRETPRACHNSVHSECIFRRFRSVNLIILFFFFIGSAWEVSHTHTAFLKREKKKFHLRTALPFLKLARTNVVNITNVQHLTFNRTLPHLLKALLFYLSVYTSAFFFFLDWDSFFSQENKQKKKKAVRVWELKCCHLHQNGTSPTIVEPGFRFKAVCVRVHAWE